MCVRSQGLGLAPCPNCAGVGSYDCAANETGLCDDGVDNDCDGLTDCFGQVCGSDG